MKSLRDNLDLERLILRIAVASIWIDAGVFNKLLNPGFLNPGSTSYIGFTVQYLAEGSPIRGFLYTVVFPHVYTVGVLVMIGEISFGVLTLLGLMSRLASTVALYTNLIYFLSAYWTGTEEYGINLLLMLLNLYIVMKGPGQFSLDGVISPRLRIVGKSLPWVVLGSAIYLVVILYLLIY
ncbi:TQO small subunit DoxD [Metallosphaera hakonensis]|uniref:DoxX family membrane protein n=1 Tax=Metallosphaera hakonensis JCM 8857 = DSM 7519 TaxID=1293036 RepID=A0A2U9ISV4_9CREN|nr:TQO small subunit DoxD [Metallosphaera hakonensis]AWR99032.1 DoxX family membrane protein [Metallosphaera hakonensis JCM 8857 = DSM 7519]